MELGSLQLLPAARRTCHTRPHACVRACHGVSCGQVALAECERRVRLGAASEAQVRRMLGRRDRRIEDVSAPR
jgi:hypothetical protein